ncbi:MAG: RluA family pseudouridine synthase [Vulcanibacillus sp.]
MYNWIVSTENSGKRIDKFLSEQSANWSRSQIQIWIKEGNVNIANKLVKANRVLAKNDEVTLKIPQQKELLVLPEKLTLDIIYEDSDVIVINKSRGMTVHPAPGHYSGTIVNALLEHCKDLSGINGVLRPGIVHRIDKDTTGLIMVAKNDFAHNSLAEQLKRHTVNRVYIALVHGVIPHDKGMIDAPIGRDPSDRKKMVVTGNNSKQAYTHFIVKERFKGYSLVECKLETGRTHQIRVHMKYIGFPIVGDPIYSNKKVPNISGQALHAKTLGFKHPRTDQHLEFDSELPEDMTKLIEEIKQI